MAQSLAVKRKEYQDSIKNLLIAKKDDIGRVVPQHMSPEKLINIFMMATSRQPTLLECSRFSLVNAFLQSTELGLPIGNTTGMAYLVPFKNNKTGKYEATFMPSYRGLAELARRTGFVTKIYAKIVYENDDFEYEEGSFPKIRHIPKITGERGSIIAVYAIAAIKGDDLPQIEVLTKADVDKVRRSSRASNSGPWSDWYEEMAKKTAIKRICKTLPMSSDLAYAMEIDNAAETGDSVKSYISGVIDIPEEDEGSTQEQGNKIADQLGIVAEDAEEE